MVGSGKRRLTRSQLSRARPCGGAKPRDGNIVSFTEERSNIWMKLAKRASNHCIH